MRSMHACLISHCTLACTAERSSPYFVSIALFFLLSLLYRFLGISFGSISRMANNNTTQQSGSSESQLGSTERQRGTLRQPDHAQSSPNDNMDNLAQSLTQLSRRLTPIWKRWLHF